MVVTILTATFLLLAGRAASENEAPAVEVKPVSVSQVTHRDLGTEQVRHWLAVTIELAGEPAAQVISYGDVTIKTAKLDTGASLTLLPVGDADAPPSGFVKVDRPSTEDDSKGDSPGTLQIELRFGPAPRTATRLVSLEGTLWLATSEREECVFDRILARRGQTLDHQMLKAANVSLRVLGKSPFDIFESAERLALRIVGDDDNVAATDDSLLEIDLLDGQRNEITRGSLKLSVQIHGEAGVEVGAFRHAVRKSFGFPSDGKALILGAKTKLGEDAMLRIVGPKTFSVPFQIEGIPLP